MADRAEPEFSLGPADNAKPEVSSDAKSPEILTPMLEVHPPHEALHTWKGFFIHIATIVIGLLIAISLEQTVEHFHHERQIATTRKALQLEHDQFVEGLEMLPADGVRRGHCGRAFLMARAREAFACLSSRQIGTKERHSAAKAAVQL
jgi:hypothetical protein